MDEPIYINAAGEPLPWEKPPEKYNCPGEGCSNLLDTPTFCSDKCRDSYYAPGRKARRFWTLKEMQDWCKEKADKVRSDKIASGEIVPEQSPLIPT